VKNLLNKTVLFLAYILCICTASAQNNAIDSLQKLLQRQKDDTGKVNLLIGLSEEFRVEKDDLKTALQYAGEGSFLADKLGYKKGRANAQFKMAQIYYRQKQYPEAKTHVDSAAILYRDIDDKKDMALIYSWIGSYYYRQALYADAIANQNKALILYQEIGDKKDIANTYREIAWNYSELTFFGDATTNIYRALRLYEELGDKEEIANALLIIGLNYENQDEDSSALVNLQAALKLRKELGNKADIATTMASLGELYTKLGKYIEALKYDSAGYKIFQELKPLYTWGVPLTLISVGENLQKIGEKADAAGDKKEAAKKFNSALQSYQESLKYYEGVQDGGSVAIVRSLMGFALIKLKDFSTAKECFRKSLQLSVTSAGNNTIRDSYLGLAILDSISGNYKEAYEHYKDYILYRDSLVNEGTAKKSLQAKMTYESEKSEAITKALQDKKDAQTLRIRNLQYFIIAALAVLLLAILLVAVIQWRNSNEKKKANVLLQLQKDKVEAALTELKSTQSLLIQSEKMASLGELTAGIAHEIQNPLNFVNNFSEVNNELLAEMKDEMNDGNMEDVKSILGNITENEQKILHHGRRADAIVKGMLLHSRASTGQKESTDINALADEYLRLSYQGLRAKDKSLNASLETDFDPAIGKINIIPQDIGRVLLNLYNNAFYAVHEKKKQMPERPPAGDLAKEVYEPTISVSTKRMADMVEIRIKDNGNGIPPGVIGKIFQPFFTTKPTGQGTGLGLSLSYDIIKAHRGELKVKTNEGKGAEFVIEIPYN
jgi:two-component system, NtrC family, sensor kinase